MNNDPFELHKPAPPVTVSMIARGVFWGLFFWTLFLFAVGFALGVSGVLR